VAGRGRVAGPAVGHAAQVGEQLPAAAEPARRRDGERDGGAQPHAGRAETEQRGGHEPGQRHRHGADHGPEEEALLEDQVEAAQIGEAEAGDQAGEEQQRRCPDLARDEQEGKVEGDQDRDQDQQTPVAACPAEDEPQLAGRGLLR